MDTAHSFLATIIECARGSMARHLVMGDYALAPYPFTVLGRLLVSVSAVSRPVLSSPARVGCITKRGLCLKSLSGP